MKILSAADSASLAAKTFKTFEEGKPELIPTGFPPVDEFLGGLYPGSPLILGALTGVGKSGLALNAALTNARNQVPTAYISLEDTPDILGGRLWAEHAGIDSLKIRRKDLTDWEIDRLRVANEELEQLTNLHFVYAISSPVEEVVAAIEELAKLGVKYVIVDYLQKMRGSSQDRRQDVGISFGRIHKASFDYGMALMIVSQVSRQPDPKKPLTIHALKESGDLENEARLILLASRTDPIDPDKITVRVAKSTFGGEKTVFSYTRQPSGWLKLDQDSDLPF